MLKKIQNHREIVNSYEIKLEEEGDRSHHSGSAALIKIADSSSIEQVELAQPQIIYQKGRRITLDAPILIEEGFAAKRPVKIVERKLIENDNRRS